MRLGEYEVVRELARGGQGAVWLGRRARDGREVAIKVLLAGQGARPEQQRRFAREVEALSRLRHPHVVAILDAGTHQGTPYLVMEYVPGRSLAERLREGPLTPREAADLTRKLAHALQHAHEQNVLHRDVKPGNVLLDAQGEPRLTDFGLTRDVDPSLSATQLSGEGRFLGTPGYLAPEQARGELEALGPGSDVFGLGALLYATLTGRPPFAGEGLLELLVRMESPPEPPSRLRAQVDPELERICLRCLAQEPAQRWESAGALADALEAWLARPIGARRARARRRGAWLGASLLLALSAAGALGWWLGRPTPFDQAWALLHPRSGEPDAARALALLEELLRAAPQDPRALALRAVARHELRDRPGAEADAARALELDPSCALAHYAQAGLLHYGGGPRDRPLSAIDRAIALDPDEPHFHVLRGRVFEQFPPQDGRAARECLAAYQRALALDPSLEDVVERVGTILVDEDDLPGAAEAFTRLIELRPDDHEAWAQRGSVRAMMGDHTRALADLDRALEMEPRFDLGYLKRAEIREAAGDPAGALADLERYGELVPDQASLEAWRRQLRERAATASGGARPPE